MTDYPSAPVVTTQHFAIAGYTSDGDIYGWRATCMCGWQGPLREQAAVARRDATRHNHARTEVAA